MYMYMCMYGPSFKFDHGINNNVEQKCAIVTIWIFEFVSHEF